MKEEIDNCENNDIIEEDNGEMDEFIGYFTDFYQP